MNDELNELERELARYRPADVSGELVRQIRAQMHRPTVRHRHFKDYIFAATVAAGILATCINVTLLAASFRSGIEAPVDQPVSTPMVQSPTGFEPTELALLQQQALVEESGGNASSEFMER
jgi:uridylate kinase